MFISKIKTHLISYLGKPAHLGSFKKRINKFFVCRQLQKLAPLINTNLSLKTFFSSLILKICTIQLILQSSSSAPTIVFKYERGLIHSYLLYVVLFQCSNWSNFFETKIQCKNWCTILAPFWSSSTSLSIITR